MKDVCAIIMAAGQGTRMRSNLVKILHPLAGRPMPIHPVELCHRLGFSGRSWWSVTRPIR